MRIEDLETPSLLLDLDIVERNVEKMAAKCRALGVALRPHAKTHKSVEVADLQRKAGAAGLTVSTLVEAEIFAAAGFTDLTWAFPVIPSKLERVRRLRERDVDLRLVVDSGAAIDALSSLVGEHPPRRPLEVMIKVDCGYHRAGVDPLSDLGLILARRLEAHPQLRFAGLLSHSGHAYDVRGSVALARVAEQERAVMDGLARRLRGRGLEVPVVSVGSTPAMSAVEDLSGVTETRPGNYVFFDATQLALGSCALEECALTVLTTVVSSQPSADHSIVDAGALALSKDSVDGVYAEIYDDLEAATIDPGRRVVSVSQEHGIVRSSVPVGTLLRLLPAHSCLAAACFDHYAVVRGQQVVDRWAIIRAR